MQTYPHNLTLLSLSLSLAPFALPLASLSFEHFLSLSFYLSRSSLHAGLFSLSLCVTLILRFLETLQNVRVCDWRKCKRFLTRAFGARMSLLHCVGKCTKKNAHSRECFRVFFVEGVVYLFRFFVPLDSLPRPSQNAHARGQECKFCDKLLLPHSRLLFGPSKMLSDNNLERSLLTRGDKLQRVLPSFFFFLFLVGRSTAQEHSS